MAKTRSRWRRRILIALGGFALLVPILWISIHVFPSFGAWAADTGRAILGPKAVAWMEDVAYAIQDRVDRWRYKDAKPKTFWDTPSAAASAPPPTFIPAAVTSTNADAGPVTFPPPDFTPPVASVAAEGDGRWIPMVNPLAPNDPTVMMKTVVHPDAKRGFAAVAVVAIDLAHVDLRLVAGKEEPFSITVPAEHRHGVIPKDDVADLVAAFNGGFKAVHGHYGMMLGGETFLAPRDIACTLALYKDGSIKIHTWSQIKSTEGDMVFYRQTPPCLVEDGKTNTQLDQGEYNRSWGATVSGETVIRRSGIGVDKTGKVLFYALGEAMTAQALSHAMRAIGAEGAAQLDVNYSYPRFLLYEKSPSGDVRVKESLIPGIQYLKAEYVGNVAERDFFYLRKRH